MVLTTDRVIVARDGLERRPQSGIQSFPLDMIRRLELELGRGPSGRIIVRTARGREAVSMFFDPRSLDRAEDLVERFRPGIARQR